ncbi:hypothetical protein EV702DRAFT_1050865 [Suillus placidus]|uniref:KOW domain-containing protein n=1 Tax=Suillus placidus TaxID=48579 RepID=A0A9P6ZHY5_9AGAM|nr:hypothetical protein EV702DRAFT_1050865 [Suillus placidus]
MAKCAASSGDEPALKHVKVNERNCRTVPSPRKDVNAWLILERFLTTDTTYPQMEDTFLAYLGDQYSPDDWKDTQATLFSGDGDDTLALSNFHALMATNIPQGLSETTRTANNSPVATSVSRRDGQGTRTVPSPREDVNAWRILERFLTTDVTYPQMEDMFLAYLSNQYSLDDWKDAQAALFSGDGDDTLALSNLRALMAANIPQGLSDMMRTAKDSPVATSASRRDGQGTRDGWSCRPSNFKRFIDDKAGESEEEEEDDDGEVEDGFSDYRPNIRWLQRSMIFSTSTKRPHRGLQSDVEPPGPPAPLKAGCIFLSFIHVTHCISGTAAHYIAEHLQDKGFSVTVLAWLPGQLLSMKEYLCISEEEREAVEHSNIKLPNPSWVRIKHGKYKGDIGYVFDPDQSNHFIMVLIPLQEFPYDMPQGSVALLDQSHLPNDSTVSDILCDGDIVGYSYKGQWYYGGLLLKNCHRYLFLHKGDAVRVLKGEVRSEIGHIIQVTRDIFDVCQEVSQEVVQVSKHYLYHCPPNYTYQSWLPTQQHFEHLPDEAIQVGDYIEILIREDKGKCGIVAWFPAGETQLWFWYVNTRTKGDTKHSSRLPIFKIPTTFVRWMGLSQTLKYTKEKGYDVKPGDVVRVAHGPEYQMKGVVQSVDFPKARLTLLSENDRSLIDIPIDFVVKLRNAPLDSFNDVIGQEVFVIRGNQKGYQATLYNIGREFCTIAMHGQARTEFKCQDIATRYGMRLNGAMLEASDLMSFCDMRKRLSLKSPPQRFTTPPPGPVSSSSSSSTNWSTSLADTNIAHDPSSIITSSSDPWSFNLQDMQDNISTRAEQVKDNGPLPWLMSKEFSSLLLKYHAVFRVSPGFMGGRLHKRFVSTACPDPFCGASGPAPDDCVMVFCTSSNSGTAVQHYHIPAKDLSPAPPCHKNQWCLILDRNSHDSLVAISWIKGCGQSVVAEIVALGKPTALNCVCDTTLLFDITIIMAVRSMLEPDLILQGLMKSNIVTPIESLTPRSSSLGQRENRSYLKMALEKTEAE